ncbi:hypothetical protein [Thermoflexus sp.]|uniref:hypothetical protein n=1 Tax=Thermoflexus sp. TaxID=1969742 RepID=UPI0035E41AD8
MAEVVREWREKGMEVWIGDRAPSHRARKVQEVGVKWIERPPDSPELHPAERIVEELRRPVERREEKGGD